MSPRVLVIAYDFPPHAAIGTMRTLRLVRELSREGWEITVLTSSPRSYQPGTPVDERLEAQVPPGVRVIRAYAIRGLDLFALMARRLRPARGGTRRSSPRPVAVGGPDASSSLFRRLKDWVDAVCSIPDNESGWIAPAALCGIGWMFSAGRPDVIYSSAPPWSGQVVARLLATLSRRPWVADFRDPWSRAPWRDWRKAFRQRAAAALERGVIRRADAVLFVTRANLAEFLSLYGPAAAPRFHHVPNGCDPEEFERIEPLPTRNEFVLLHAGTLYGARNPLPVIQALARAVGRGSVDRTHFRLRFLGATALSMDLPAECRRLGIGDIVEFVPRVTRLESLREMKSASALLLVQVGTTVSVPGKAYEYLAVGRPVLALSEEGETADLVRASGLGVVVHPVDPIERIETAILEVIALASGGRGPASPELFDGRVHARTTVRILDRFARYGGRDVRDVAPLPVHGGAVPRQESRR